MFLGSTWGIYNTINVRGRGYILDGPGDFATAELFFRRDGGALGRNEDGALESRKGCRSQQLGVRYMSTSGNAFASGGPLGGYGGNLIAIFDMNALARARERRRDNSGAALDDHMLMMLDAMDAS